MPTLKIMIGLPGSGKSSYADKYMRNDNTVYLSSDFIRKDMFGFEDQTHNNQVFSRMNSETIFSLQTGFDVIYDATNLSAKRRMALINSVKRSVEDVYIDAYLMCVPINIILERNLTRTERHLPWEKLIQMITYLESPMYYEGFDNIYLINGGMYDDIYGFTDMINKCKDYQQDNPYHNATLGQHILTTVRRTEELSGNLLSKSNARILIEAAKYHDFGKIYCRTYNEKKNYYSYYGHENVSTYMYLCHIRKNTLVDVFGRVKLTEARYKTAALILNHMQWYHREDMSVIKDRFKDNDLFNMLELLHWADKYRE